MQADRLQVLFHTLVVLDLSRNRNGHRLAAGAAGEFSRFAAWMKEEAKDENLCLDTVSFEHQERVCEAACSHLEKTGHTDYLHFFVQLLQVPWS